MAVTRRQPGGAAQAPVGGRPCGWVTAAPHLILAYVGEDGTCVGAGVGGDGASGCDEGCGCLVSDRSARRRRSSSLSELVQRRVTDVLAARGLERQFEAIADDVTLRLVPLCERELPGLAEGDKRAALDAVVRAFAAADLSDEGLFAVDADPAKLAAVLGSAAKPALKGAALGEAGTR